MQKIIICLALCCRSIGWAAAQDLDHLTRLPEEQTRSIGPENFKGAKGGGALADPISQKSMRNMANNANEARDLGFGWKVNPFVLIAPGETFTLADIEGPGIIRHIWMTPSGNWNFSILRCYWDDETQPSVESPVGPFFGMAWGVYAPLRSLTVTVNPASGFNSYWLMPFRKKARITIENLDDRPLTLFYQVDYALTPVDKNRTYFHAEYRRDDPDSSSLYTILEARGNGLYVGTFMGITPHNNGWWGEGEVKFFIDGDKEAPTIAGTGTEDYFGGSYDFDTRQPGRGSETAYTEFTGPYTGLHQVIRGDGHYEVMQRFGMYRWHIPDPIRFEKDLKVTIQDLGWRSGRRYLAQHSDIITVAYWYQLEPHAPFPLFPKKDALEIN